MIQNLIYERFGTFYSPSGKIPSLNICANQKASSWSSRCLRPLYC